MPAGEVYIKLHSGITPVNNSVTNGWVDVYKQYGMSLSDTALSALMTPAPNKALVENVSRNQHGKQVVKQVQYVKKDSRDLSLEMHIRAATRSQWLENYNRFCTEILDYGYFEMKHSSQDNVIYRLVYLSCPQFSEFVMQIAKYNLRVNEPNPDNRGVTDSDSRTYTVKSSVTGNPHDQGLYERYSTTDDYRLTWDTSPVSGKTYYERSV